MDNLSKINNKWDKQVKPLSWLIEKFWPIPYWKQEDLDKLKIYVKYTSK